MKAKQYLKQLDRLEKSIKRRMTELEELKELSTSIGSFDYAKDNVTSSKSLDAPYVRIINELEAKEGEMQSAITLYLQKKRLIVDQIEGLVDKEVYSEILYKKYVEFKSLELISLEMGYSYPRTKHLHIDALVYFEDKYLKSTPISTE